MRAGLAVAVVLAGCAGGSPAVRYHALSVSAPDAVRPYAGPPIAVRTVQMPPGVDRIEMARDVGPGQFVVREFDQWAAPLGGLVRQALAEDLAARLGASAVVVPGGQWPASRLELSIDVLSHRVTDGTAVLALTWALRPVGTTPAADLAGPREDPQALRLEARMAGDDAGSLAAAWTSLIGQLADRVATAAASGRRATAPP